MFGGVSWGSRLFCAVRLKAVWVWGKGSRDVMSKLTGVSDASTSSFKRRGLGYSSKGSIEASQEQLPSLKLPSSHGSCSRSDLH